MVFEQDKSSVPARSEAELEWLLCLAAELQACREKKSATKRAPPPEPAKMSRLSPHTLRLLRTNFVRIFN